jgi:hypothetical protein
LEREKIYGAMLRVVQQIKHFLVLKLELNNTFKNGEENVHIIGTPQLTHK